ncbi:MAG: hypothetical protein ACRD2B_05800 [Terriglobia bacterium]
MSMKFRITLFLLLLGVVGAAPIFAGSAAIGTVAGSLNATVSGQALLANGTVFSGDQLQVNEGAAVIALANGSRMTLGSETQAQFFKGVDGVTLALAKGNVSLFHPANGSAVAVDAASWSITPAKGYKTIGRVAMLNGDVMVTAKEGSLHVTGNGRAMDVAQGKTITLLPKNAAMPQTGTSQKLVSGNEGLEAGALGAGVAAAILAGIGMSRAGDARDAANAADSQAAAATSAATAANSSAMAAGAAANAAGCAVNNVATTQSMTPSPYTPPTGFTCP